MLVCFPPVCLSVGFVFLVMRAVLVFVLCGLGVLFCVRCLNCRVCMSWLLLLFWCCAFGGLCFALAVYVLFCFFVLFAVLVVLVCLGCLACVCCVLVVIRFVFCCVVPVFF